MKIFFLFFIVSLHAAAQPRLPFTLELSTPASFEGQRMVLSIHDFTALDPFRFQDTAVVRRSKIVFRGTLTKPAAQASLFIRNEKQQLGCQLALDTGYQSGKLAWQQNINKISVRIPGETNLVQKELNEQFRLFYDRYGIKDPGNPGIRTLENHRSRELNWQNLYTVLRHNRSYYSLVVFNELVGSRHIDRQTLLESLNAFSADLQQTALGRKLREQLVEQMQASARNKMGQPVMDITAMDTSGVVFSNKSLSAKTYFIAFSATWCIPCKLAEKNLWQLYEKYHAKGFEVIYINLDDDQTVWKKNIREHRRTWINISENVEWSNSRLSKLYFVDAIPAGFLIHNNTIVYNADQLDDTDYIHLEEFIKRYL